MGRPIIPRISVAFVRCAFLFFVLFSLCTSLDNGLARSPPMGWSSWNYFRYNISEQLFREIGETLVEKKLKDLGYIYVNVDDGWYEGLGTGRAVRNSSGYLQYSKSKFPSTINSLSDYLHSLGLKWGMYTDAGNKFCGGDFGASQGHEIEDARQFVAWGSDYVKIDACAAHRGPRHTMMIWRDQFNRLTHGPHRLGNPIVISDCRIGCRTDMPGPTRNISWCSQYANMWRTSRDIRPDFLSVIGNLHSVVNQGKVASPGGWNDPDSLEVGNGMTYVEDKAHFSLWAVISAPLILGNDLRNMSDETFEIISNEEVISVNQQYCCGNAGDRVSIINQTEVWAKPLTPRKTAVVLLNTGEVSTDIYVDFEEISLEKRCSVRDLWEHRDLGSFDERFSATVAPHGVVMVVITSDTDTDTAHNHTL